MKTTTPEALGFSALLQEAIAVPGRVHEAYTAFHNYSIGNQLLALMQCRQRGIAPGPIATFAKWKERGRYVQKGEKAVVLCQPVTIKKATEGGASDNVNAPRDECSWSIPEQPSQPNVVRYRQ